MDYEEHPYPESFFWRLGVPASTVLLTAVVCVALFTMAPGAALTAVVAVALVLGAIGVLARGIRHRRAGRWLDRGWLVQSFAFFWAFWVGFPELSPFDSEDGPLERVLFGLSFAVFVTVFQWLAFRPLGPSRNTTRDGAGPDSTRSV